MVKTKGNQQTVQETNDHSILSKASIAEHGYFADPYLKLFCSRLARRSPLIHRGYYVRAKAIDYILTSFLLHCGCQRSQIVSIGAGFDASYFRLKSSNQLSNCTFYDVDFPDVIRRKHSIIQKQNILQNIIGEFTIQDNVLRAKDYYTLSCDVTDLKKLELMFCGNQVDFVVPTLVFSECALTYVEYEDSKNLCQFLRNRFPNLSVVSYEQVNPDDAFGIVMLRHFEKIQSPLERIHQLHSIQRQIGLFKELQYEEAVGLDMNFFYEHFIEEEEKSRMEMLEVFDEFEEWHLKCAHYCIVAGIQGECVGSLGDVSKFRLPLSAPNSINAVAIVDPVPHPSPSQHLQRYGHACARLTPTRYLVTGGFGMTQQQQHDKLTQGFILNMSTDGSMVTTQHINTDSKAMYHSVTAVSENSVFVFGGRVSPARPWLEYGLYEIQGSILCPVETFQLGGGDAEDAAPRPQPRWRHRAVKYADHIIVSGGRSLDNVILNDLWSFDLKTKQWKLIELTNPLPCCHTHSLHVWKDSLVLYGGLSTLMKTLDQLLTITLNEEKSMGAVKNIHFEQPLPPRYSHSSHVVGDIMYVVGGIDPLSDSQPPILVISLANKIWKAAQLPALDPSEDLLMLHNHCSVMTDEDTVVVVGGGGNCFSFGTHFNTQLFTIKIPSILEKDGDAHTIVQ